MPQIVAQKYSLVNVEPSTLVMTQIDEMFRDLFTGLRNSAVGSANSQELALDASSFTQGDLLYIVDTVGTVDGLTVGATAGLVIRSPGTPPRLFEVHDSRHLHAGCHSLCEQRQRPGGIDKGCECNPLSEQHGSVQ